MPEAQEKKYSAYEVAKWIKETARIHEESWKRDKSIMGIQGGRYKTSIQEAAYKVCPEPWGQIVYLALSQWWNDTLDWAKQQIEEVDGPADA